MRRWQMVALAIATVSLAAVILLYLAGRLAEIPAVVLGVLAIVIDVVMYVLSRFLGKPDLKVRPLPHLRGWVVPSGDASDFEFFDGEEPRIGVTPNWGKPTHPERVGHGMHPSQVLELVWPNPTSLRPDGKLLVEPSPTEPGKGTASLRLNFQARKFGVISVTNRGAEAEHCSAHGQYRLKNWPSWHDLGELNWYSRTKRAVLKINTSKLRALKS